MTAPDADLPGAYRLLVAEVYELAGRSRRTSDALARAAGQSVARWHLMSVVSDGPRSVAGAYWPTASCARCPTRPTPVRLA